VQRMVLFTLRMGPAFEKCSVMLSSVTSSARPEHIDQKRGLSQSTGTGPFSITWNTRMTGASGAAGACIDGMSFSNKIARELGKGWLPAGRALQQAVSQSGCQWSVAASVCWMQP
jgi:hypothetical protein